MVKIVDSICGSGKTSWAIQEMNIRLYDRFIYITPFLDEVKRVKSQSNRIFQEPNEKKGKGKKKNHFYELVKEGEDIVSTHSLFRGLNQDIKDCIKENEYILILDEVMDVVEQIRISTDDINILLNQKIISVDEENKVYWIDDNYQGEFRKHYNSIKNGDVYLHNGIMILWTFPYEIFKSFKEVYILTYMFKGQIQRYYYDLNDVDYEYVSVEKVGDEFKLVEYKNDNGNKFKNLINIYEGKMNDIGDDKYALSVSWYEKASKKAAMRTLKNNTYNYFRNNINGKAKDNMWTTFKEYFNECKGKSYTNGFVECNARATNDFKHKNNLAYLVNRFYNPMMTQFFISKGVSIDEDIWALSELIQWLFRSAIREGNKINIYIPSSRMRNLLKQWLK